jgi:hypothetical protein
MQELTETTISCPYCAEPNGVLLDPQEADQSYIEDCQVCCRPIVFVLSANDGEISARVLAEND